MSDVTFSGSCLCGAIHYEITGPAGQFWHCHCQRCRKATGTGHASNIIIRPTSVDWSSGADLLRYYKIPEAKRFAKVFCSSCGSPMPRVAPDGSIAVIPAGSLDTDPGILPQGRIFQDSRAAWSCQGDNLPVFGTFPERD